MKSNRMQVFKEFTQNLINRYDFLDLGQKLWHIQSLTNPNYNRFLIKQIVS